jgi:hypothetical protein
MEYPDFSKIVGSDKDKAFNKLDKDETSIPKRKRGSWDNDWKIDKEPEEKS